MATNTIRIVVEGTAASSGGAQKGAGGSRQVLTELSQIEAQSKNLIDLQNKLRAALRALSVSGQPSEEAQKIANKLKQVNAEVSKWNKLGRENSNTWSNALSSYQFKFNALGNIISNVVSSSVNMMMQLGKTTVTIGKDFEFAMSGVRAITMATDKEFKQLTNDAIRLGGDTLYTATQISKLQEELAKLGFTTEEILSSTNGIVALAAATGEDLAQSALVAGTVIRGFGLDASETTRIVDIMAQAFNASALDLYKFQETMKYVAPVASKTGFTMEEVTAIMARLADQGVIASQAGTSLRNLFLRLADSNSKLSKSIGFTVNNLPQLVVGLENLKNAGLDATKALSLADRYSVTALLALAEQSGGIWELYESISSTSGAAKEMADIRMDNFAGSIEKLTGAWDSLVLSINKSNSVLRAFVDVGTGALEYLSQFILGYQSKVDNAVNDSFEVFKENNNRRDSELKQAYNREAKLQYESYKRGEITINEFKNNTDELDKMYAAESKKLLNSSIENSILRAKEDVKLIEDANLKKNASQQQYYDQLKGYIDKLESYKKDVAQSEIKSLSDIAIEEAEKEKERAQKIADLRIKAMREGLAKELAEMNNFYDDLESDAAEFGITDIDFTVAREEAKLRIIKEWNEKVLKEQKEQRAKLNELNKQEYLSSFAGLGVEKPGTSALMPFREAAKKAWGATDSRELAPSTMKIIAAPEKENFFESIFGKDTLTEDQKQSLKEGFDFIKDQLEQLADKEAEIADRRVEASERALNQKQQELETEIALAEAGFASNVSLKQRELEEAKKEQAKALALQEQALERRRKLEEANQLISLITTSAEIIQNAYNAKDPLVGSIIAGISLAAMWSMWGYSKAKAAEATKYGEGGEIGGNKHSQGGTIIEAEKGEFVVRASAYSKHADLVQAINNDNLNQIYGELNKDLSVSLDDTGTARMLNKHFGRPRVTYHNGYRIEESANRKRIIRYAKL